MLLSQTGYRPHPDEEGTESLAHSRETARLARSYRPHPDEEGTERAHIALASRLPGGRATDHIPMKRELKGVGNHSKLRLLHGYRPHPDEEGTESSQQLCS